MGWRRSARGDTPCRLRQTETLYQDALEDYVVAEANKIIITVALHNPRRTNIRTGDEHDRNNLRMIEIFKGVGDYAERAGNILIILADFDLRF